VGRLWEGTTAAGIALALLALLTVPLARASFLGSDLESTPDTGVCYTTGLAPEASCTESQLQLTRAHIASGGLLAASHGVITSWRVASGPASPATAGVQLRLRVLRGGAPVAGDGSPYVSLPLAEPGVHRFPTRLPIERNGELGLDVVVLGSGGGVGSAPIAHTDSGLGEIAEWVPPLATRAQPVTAYQGDTELLLGARVEPDLDRDAYGDQSQDRCPYDPRRHTPCLPDHLRPGIEVDYDRRQDFLATRKASLRVRPSEFSRVVASGQMELPTTTWGIYSASAWVRQGSAKLVLRIPPRALKAGRAALARGARVSVRSFVTVIDASGNRTHRTVRILSR